MPTGGECADDQETKLAEPAETLATGREPHTTHYGPLMQRTFILLKPDCVQRRLMGRILARFEDKGLNVVAMKMMRITPELAKKHYAEHVQKGWYPTLEGFITGGPSVAAVLAGLEASPRGRAML